MDDLILQCLQNQHDFFESTEMCCAILQGGYEKYIQTRIGFELYRLTERRFLTERDRADILGDYNQAKTAIEIGVNALSNARPGVINHMVDDVAKIFRANAANQVYTIGTVDSMCRCNNIHHLPIVKYPERYLIPIDENKRKAELTKITNSDQFFAHPSLQVVQSISFTTAIFEGYQMELHFFICGPFTEPLVKWWQ